MHPVLDKLPSVKIQTVDLRGTKLESSVMVIHDERVFNYIKELFDKCLVYENDHLPLSQMFSVWKWSTAFEPE